MAGMTVVLAIIHVLLINEKSNLDEPKIKLDKESLKKYFFFPTHDARDFYLALSGKFLMVVGSTIVPHSFCSSSPTILAKAPNKLAVPSLYFQPSC